MSDENTYDLVRRAYGDVARKRSACCGQGSPCCGDESAELPVPEAELGLSCGTPLAFGHVNEGDVVVDLGSGAGKDAFLAARKVGPAGRAIGVDMTPEMISLARENAVKFTAATGLENVEFREARMEELPLGDGDADVVISNCVVNLSPDKPRVFREVYRVLKPGGRLIVSDIVLNRPLPEDVRGDADLYVACLAGALLRTEYLDAIRESGFDAITVLSDRTYSGDGGEPFGESGRESLAGVAASITVLAVK